MTEISGTGRTMRVKKAGGFDFPVAADAVIKPGAFVELKAGFLQSADGTGFWIGRATGDAHGRGVDNTDGSDGDVTCHVDFMKERTFAPWIGKDGEFAQADVGAAAYAVDNQTATKTGTGGGLGLTWKIETIRGVQIVWVEV
jgi:hypothetical protein